MNAPAEETPAHALGSREVAAILDVDPAVGLSSAEAARRLVAAGPNLLERPHRPPYLRIAARQLASPLMLLLVAAAGVSASIGEGLEAAVIGAIVVLNAVLGFVLEAGAERQVLALHESLRPDVTVVRDGREVVLPSEELVPGDVVKLREGDRVPADARLVVSQGLEVDESMLTGESAPVAKSQLPVAQETTLAERTSMVYAGTAVSRGSAVALVTATGRRTEQGGIAGLAAAATPPRTPLQRRLGRLARVLAVAGGAVTVALAGAMLLRGEPAREAFLVGVSVAVAAVPEGLAATLTVALALGSRAMSRRGAIVRSLDAIETVGEATVIAADKTGTLTQNRLGLERVEPAVGRGEHDVLAAARAASAAEVDPVDRALVEAAAARGVAGPEEVVRSLPFQAERKRAAVVVRDAAAYRAVVKGAPEEVLGRCAPGDRADAERLLGVASSWAQDGVRVLAVGTRPLEDPDARDLEQSLHPIGLVGLADPLRETAEASVAEARALGLRVRMLTGDHALTAHAVGARLGLAEDEIDARVTPAGKLALVEGLQAAGDVVAVTGDGVNDAPALRQADVGIAMGASGSEAAREASAIVLTDDDFATIVAAVREGRRVGSNVRSFLAFLLSANVGELVLFAAAVGGGLGVPMTVVQVLVVNLLTDGPPALALAADPATRGRVWLQRGSPLLRRGLVAGLLGVALLVGLAALTAFLVLRELRPAAAQTGAFATIALAELALVFACRSDLLPSSRLEPNRLLWLAVGGSAGLLAALLYVPAFHGPFGTVALRPLELALVVALAAVPFLAAESAKALARSRRRPGV